MEVKLINYTPDPLVTIETAAGNCYGGLNKPGSGKTMAHCYKNGHHSVFEHVSFTFKISGVSRALMAQLTRHRIGAAFSIRSQRYCDEGEFSFVVPDSIKHKDKYNELYSNFMKIVHETYTSFVSIGIPKEDARYILPNACCTDIVCTMNLRELIHFCNERMCTRAQWEIRELANRMRNEVIVIFPEACYMLVPKCEVNSEHPFCTEGKTGCGRHKPLGEM